MELSSQASSTGSIFSRRLSVPFLQVVDRPARRSLPGRLWGYGSNDSQLCSKCRGLDLELALEVRALEPAFVRDGRVVGPVSRLSRSCAMCQALASMSVIQPTGDHADSTCTQLRAFPLIPNISATSWCDGSVFLASCKWSFGNPRTEEESEMLENLVSKKGCLLVRPRDLELSPRAPASRPPAAQLFQSRKISPFFDPTIVHKWFTCCVTHHKNCGTEDRLVPGMKLIDCRTLCVVTVDYLTSTGSEMPDFLALSYVWGGGQPWSNATTNGRLNPRLLTKVISDAIEVTKVLGFRYIWIDKFCVDQNDCNQKHQQIMHMDSVYENATMTIIAAAGSDETTGLPGISSARCSKQISIQTREFDLTSTLPSPATAIPKTRWASRAWTYQEAILSRRRLVFTEGQLYFECNALHCYESLDMDFDKLYQDQKVDISQLFQPKLFGFMQFNSRPLRNKKATPFDRRETFLQCAEEYSRRTLSFDADALNAFCGITKRLESLSRIPVRHVWGVPLFHPRDNIEPQPLQTWLAIFMAGLSWMHPSSAKPRQSCKGFPTWAWTGWEGAVRWPRPTSLEMVGFSDGHVMPTVSFESSNGDIEQFEDLDFSNFSLDKDVRRPRALIIETTVIPRTAFTLSRKPRRLSIGGGQVRVYSHLTMDKIFGGILSGDYAAMRLVTIDDDVYYLLVSVSQCSAVAYRLGIMVVKSFFLAFSQNSVKDRTRIFHLK